LERARRCRIYDFAILERGKGKAMKIFLMYYDRFENATTSKILKKEHIVLCHNNKEKFNCISENGTLIETKEPKGIQNNFNYGLSLLKKDEWGVFYK
jgi:hypothetical protein